MKVLLRRLSLSIPKQSDFCVRQQFRVVARRIVEDDPDATTSPSTTSLTQSMTLVRVESIFGENECVSFAEQATVNGALLDFSQEGFFERQMMLPNSFVVELTPKEKLYADAEPIRIQVELSIDNNNQVSVDSEFAHTFENLSIESSSTSSSTSSEE